MKPDSTWQGIVTNVYVSPLLMSSISWRSVLSIWMSGKASGISWFLSKKRAYFQCLGFSSSTLLPSVNKWQKELSNWKIYHVRVVVCGCRWSTSSLVSLANIPKMRDLRMGAERMCSVAWQRTFPFAAADLVSFLGQDLQNPLVLVSVPAETRTPLQSPHHTRADGPQLRWCLPCLPRWLVL